MLENTIQLISRFNKVLIAGILLLTAILFYWFAKVEVGASMAGLMPPSDDPDFVFLDNTYDDFGSEYFLLISLTHDKIFSYPTLRKIQRLTSEIREHPAVDRVLSLTNANIVKSKGDEIYVETVSEKIPTTRWEIAQFRKDIMQNPLYEGKLVSADGKTTVISVFFEATARERKLREKILRDSIEEVKGLAFAAAGPEEIQVTGYPAVTSTIYKMLVTDLSTYIPVSILIIALILFINFRSWWCTLMSVLVITTAIVWTYASMALLDIPIFLLTSFMPPVIAALGISYSVHLFTEYFRQRPLQTGPKNIVTHTIRNILLAIWLSAMTTAIGFASLSVFAISGIRELSAFLVIGVLSLLILVTFLIPSILVYIRPRPGTGTTLPRHPPKRPSSRFADWIVRHRYRVFVASGFAAIACTLGLIRLDINTTLLDLFKPSAPIRQATEQMMERFRRAIGFSLIIETEKEGGVEDPSLLKSIEAMQSFLERQPSVGRTTSVVDYLKSVNEAFHHNNTDYYVLPESKQEISQYLLAYSLADPLRTLDNYIDYHHKVARISIPSALTTSSSVLQFRNLVEEQCAKLLPANSSCQLTSDSVLIATSTQKIARGILLSFGLAALAISAVMFVLFRSIKIGLVAMIPNFLPLIAILAVMGWAGITFNAGTSIIICLALGIAVDDTIHFLTRYFHELKRSNHYLIRAMTNIRITDDQIRCIGITFRRVRRPVILTSIVIFCGFMSLAFSQFVPVIHFGTLTAVTMIFCLICDLILLPALLASIKI